MDSMTSWQDILIAELLPFMTFSYDRQFNIAPRNNNILEDQLGAQFAKNNSLFCKRMHAAQQMNQYAHKFVKNVKVNFSWCPSHVFKKRDRPFLTDL